jgi:FAD/FMN-containing dehydrogenase
MTGDDKEKQMIDEAVHKLYRRTIELGGTLTGEHGIGLHKGKYLPWEFDEATLGIMRTIKETFDPHNVFNPGKVFPA